MEKIDELRKEIDECDKALVKVFERRMKIVTEVLDYKRNNNLPILNSQREQAVLDKVLKELNNEDFLHEVESLFREIFRISRRLQSKRLFPFNIVLIGFMGTGKTTIGKELAKKLEMDSIDIDLLIVERVGMDINQIFAEYGEEYFRKVEKEIISEASELENKIIICGGGVVLNKENIENLRRNGKIVLLEAEPKTIFDRIRTDDSRPVLKGRMNLEEIEGLINYRDEFYKGAADIIIKTDSKTVDNISNEIIIELNKN